LIVYHSGFEVAHREGPYTPSPARGVDRLVKSLSDAEVKPGSNVYAEIGSTWWHLLRRPDEAAHVLGKLLLAVGEDNLLWGTDSIFYGSPQSQIDAFRAFQIPAEWQERFGYPALTDSVKRKVLGGNAARLYGVEPVTSRLALGRDEVEEARRHHPVPNLTWGPKTREAVRHFRDHHRGWP
jgi:predicted TIM-barrel fold metal-dependent hydrolase